MTKLPPGANGIDVTVTLQVQDKMGDIKAYMHIDEHIDDRKSSVPNITWDFGNGNTSQAGAGKDHISIISKTGPLPGNAGTKLASCTQKLEVDGVTVQDTTEILFRRDADGNADFLFGGVPQKNDDP